MASEPVVPDVAIPDYSKISHAQRQGLNTKRAFEKQKVTILIEEDDDDNDEDKSVDDDDAVGRDQTRVGYDKKPRPSPEILFILSAVAALLLILGGIIVSKNRQPTPLCSQQPEWNQYNCRAY